MKRKPAKTSKSVKSKSVRFNCPMCDPKAKTRPWLILICLALLVIGASVLVINGGKKGEMGQGEQKEQMGGWKSYTHEKIKDLSYNGFKLFYPKSWKLTVNGKEIKENNVFSIPGADLHLTLVKNGATISIIQIATGGAVCSFPGDNEVKGVNNIKFYDYSEMPYSSKYLWRRATVKDNKNLDMNTFTLCQKSKLAQNFDTGTIFGSIVYEIPKRNLELVNEADEIIKKIEILE